jgi:hypothetical protein
MRPSSILTLLPLALLFVELAHAGPTESFPEISSGNNPHRSYGGDLCETPTTLLTVPVGQEFIVTGASGTIAGAISSGGSWYTGTLLLADDTVILAGMVMNPRSIVSISTGSGHLPVGEGATLSIRRAGDSGASCGNFYLQGYYVQAGSPYRVFFGTTTDGEVFTAEAERDFIAKTVVVYSHGPISECHVWVDDAKLIDGSSMLIVDYSAYSGSFGGGGLAHGRAQLVVPAGSVLRVGPDPGSTRQCDFYIEGEYVAP